MAADLKVLLAALLLSVSQIVTAKPLPDPTRPAINLYRRGIYARICAAVDQGVVAYRI